MGIEIDIWMDEWSRIYIYTWGPHNHVTLKIPLVF